MKTPQSHSKASEAYIKITQPNQDEVWEKGKIQKIRWESKGIRGNVKILLVGESAKPIEVARNTINSGLYNYIVPRNLHDGTYKIQVMKVDESIKGESSATITIGSQKLGSLKVTPQPEQVKPATVGKSGTQTGTAPTGATVGEKTSQVASTAPAATAPPAGATPSAGATPPAGTTASTGVTPSTTSTPSKAGTPSAGIAGKTPTAAEKVVKQQFTAVKVSEAELKNLPVQKSVAGTTNLKLGGKSTEGEKIEVTSPKDGDLWEAGKEYGITWGSAGITGDVKIVLEKIIIYPGGKQSVEEHPIVDRTANSGSYRFRVPVNFTVDPHGYSVRVSSLDGRVSGKSRGAITVNTQYIDLECMLRDSEVIFPSRTVKWGQTDPKVDHVWLKINVWWRNNGLRGLSLDTVLVRIIKEPDNVVCYQEDWAVGQVSPGAWYKLPEPKTFDVINWVTGKGISFRAEVELDPQNRLGENEQLRSNNKATKRWIITPN